MAQTNNNGNKNENSMRKKIVMGIIAVGALLSVILILIISFQPSLTVPAESKSVATTIDQQNGVSRGDFYFHICGDEQDPAKTIGTPENPAILSRSLGEATTISFCVSADDKESKVLLVGLESYASGPISSTMNNGKFEGRVAEGVTASVDKSSLSIAASNKNADSSWSPSKNNGAVDTFAVSVSADTSAQLGKQMFGVSMSKPDENGVSGGLIIQWVYVNVVE